MSDTDLPDDEMQILLDFFRERGHDGLADRFARFVASETAGRAAIRENWGLNLDELASCFRHNRPSDWLWPDLPEARIFDQIASIFDRLRGWAPPGSPVLFPMTRPVEGEDPGWTAVHVPASLRGASTVYAICPACLDDPGRQPSRLIRHVALNRTDFEDSSHARPRRTHLYFGRCSACDRLLVG